MHLVPGTLVDRYRVEAEIGRGGLARVYRVRHKNLDTLHALKVLSVGGAELRERLLREGKVQSQLDHPNIVPVRDVIDLPEGPALLMDYIDGPTLDRWMLEEQPDAADRERVFLEILEGVDFAHARGIIHRDLKPGNVMMALQRGVWRPRVADFGLAKMINGDEDPGALQSHTGRPMGTPAYMSPEQVRSAKNVDQRTDVFALGCILYELVCNQRAFVGEDTLEVFNRVTQGRYRPPRDLVRGLAPRLEAALFGALAIQPDERIPDCATLAKVVRGEITWARPTAVDATMDGSTFDEAPPIAPLSVVPGNTLNFTGTVTLRPDAAVVEGVLSPAPPARRPALWMGVVLGIMLLLAAVAIGWLARPAAQVPVAAPVVHSPIVPVAPTPPPASAPPPHAPPVAPVVAAPVVAAPVVAPPEPRPPPDPPPDPPRSRLATVMFAGDARSVGLRAADGATFSEGEVPPGSYLIQASFDAGPPIHAGNLLLRAGQRVRLDCRASTSSCSQDAR